MNLPQTKGRICLECGVEIFTGHDCFFFERLQMNGHFACEPIVLTQGDYNHEQGRDDKTMGPQELSTARYGGDSIANRAKTVWAALIGAVRMVI